MSLFINNEENFRLKKRSVKKSKGGMLPASLLTQIKSRIDDSLISSHGGVEESKHEDNYVEKSKEQLKSELENCKKELEISKRFAEKEKERAENLQKNYMI